MIAGALIGAAWDWTSKMGAPLIAALLIGWVARGQHEKIDELKATVAGLSAEKGAAVSQIEAAAKDLAAASSRERETQTALLDERERFYAVLGNNRPAVDGCAFDDDARERLRVKAEAASRFSLGALPGGDPDAESVDR